MENLLQWIQNFLLEGSKELYLMKLPLNDLLLHLECLRARFWAQCCLLVNDLPAEVKSYCKLFADDTKLFYEISGLQDHEILQNDMFELYNWTMKWLLFFNSYKCKIMHIGNNNPKFSYKMFDTII